MTLLVGTAGWSIPSKYAACFEAHGSHLERYASRFSAVEINSSFYRSHQAKTYTRWSAATPAEFRFAVKIPKKITHESRLVGVNDAVDRFLEEVGGLGDKLGALLVQLPPSLAYDGAIAADFFERLRERFDASIVCEPRHASWFASEVDATLQKAGVSRVAADPARTPDAAVPGGDPRTAYFRLHGTPRMYYSSYTKPQLMTLARRLIAAGQGATVWCIFDNTVLGAAIENALELSGNVELSRA